MISVHSVTKRSCFAILSLTMGVANAWAQSSKLPDPLNPGVTGPAVTYESTFSDFQRFREEPIRPWTEVNQEVADSAAKGSTGMKGMHGSPMSGTDSKTGEPPKSKEGAAAHDMGAMKHTPGKPMPGMDSKAGAAPKSTEGAAGHDMGSMKQSPGKPMPGATSKRGAGMKDVTDQTMPGMKKPSAGAPMHKDDHGAMAMAKPQTTPGQPGSSRPTAGLTGTGIVQSIDKANGKVQLTHDPIAALNWPKMTMSFRLKDGSLADQVKQGDKVEFSLEKSSSGYVISRFHKGAAGDDMKQIK